MTDPVAPELAPGELFTSPQAVLICAAVGLTAAVVLWQRSVHEIRDDVWDRRKQGRSVWRWYAFDRDGHKVIKLRLYAVLAALVAIVPVAFFYFEWLAATALLAAAGVAVWRAQRRRGRTPVEYSHAAAMPDQIVYAFACFDKVDGQLEAIKIGYTENLDQRLAAVDDEQKITDEILLAHGPGDRSHERAIHDRLASYRLPRRGVMHQRLGTGSQSTREHEYFRPTPTVLAEVEALEYQHVQLRRRTA